MQTPIPLHFADRLSQAVRQKRSPAVVGLDPRWQHLPAVLRPTTEDPQAIAQAYWLFCRDILDAVAPWVPAVKPQSAFFEQLGPAGMNVLARVIAACHQRDLIVILDAKRGDIGSTAAAYAAGYLGAASAWQADAITVNPYLGDDSLEPFVHAAVQQGCGAFVLVKTSNPGSRMFQDLRCDQQPVYQHVAEYVERLAGATAGSSGYGAIGAVVGATFPEELSALRAQMPHAWILVPGYGAQGATAHDVGPAFDDQGLGAIVNSSRDIIFAYERNDYAHYGSHQWQDAVTAAIESMVRQLREITHGRLT